MGRHSRRGGPASAKSAGDVGEGRETGGSGAPEAAAGPGGTLPPVLRDTRLLRGLGEPELLRRPGLPGGVVTPGTRKGRCRRGRDGGRRAVPVGAGYPGRRPGSAGVRGAGEGGGHARPWGPAAGGRDAGTWGAAVCGRDAGHGVPRFADGRPLGAASPDGTPARGVPRLADGTPARGAPQVRGGHPEQREGGGGWGELRQSGVSIPRQRQAPPGGPRQDYVDAFGEDDDVFAPRNAASAHASAPVRLRHRPGSRRRCRCIRRDRRRPADRRAGAGQGRQGADVHRNRGRRRHHRARRDRRRAGRERTRRRRRRNAVGHRPGAGRPGLGLADRPRRRAWRR